MKRHRRSGRGFYSLVPLLLAWMVGGWLGSAPSTVRAQDAGAKTKSIEITEKGEPITSGTTTTAGADEAAVTSGTLAMLRRMEAKHKDDKTIHALFDQVRVDDVWMEEVKSRGELWFDKPSRFRCDYADPQKMITLIIDDALYNYVPELNQVDYWTFQSPQERDQQIQKLLIGFGFKADELVKQYEIHSSEDQTAPREELVKEKFNPQKEVLFMIKPRPAYEDTCPFKLLKVYIDKTKLLPDKIWYKDTQDASMALTMRTIEMNVPLSNAIFDKNKLFPKGTEFIDRRNTTP